ncbi:MAG: methionyl-tRNA formyltransferase [Candidatus Coproplasma sp.]
MKIIFAGSPEYAVPSLRALVESGREVVAVITQPDKPTGRKRVLTPTPVKAYAVERGIPVYEFTKIREHAQEVKDIGADVMITCAYGQILSKEILLSFPMGVWNLHASLLPRFRGASPIQSAILAGETHTGVTVMHTEVDLDTGDILLVKRCEIGDRTSGELSEELSLISAQAVVEAVELLESGQNQVLMQDEARATYCKKIEKSDAKINFSESAVKVKNLINAMSPQPLAYCTANGVQLNIIKAALAEDRPGQTGEVVCADKKNGIVIKCGDGAINVLSAQFAGGKALQAADLINGRKIKVGDILD